MKTSFAALSALALVAGLSAPADAQGAGPIGNRRVLGTAVLPGSAPGQHDVHLAWTVELGGLTSSPIDLSTEAVLLVDGVEMAVVLMTVTADGGAGDCGSCTGGCGSGYLDGAINTLLCLEDGSGPSAGCECRFPSILSSFPGTPMQPGDEIMVLLRPAPGALPDSDHTDDIDRLIFGGMSVAWDRKLRDVELQPSSTAADSFFDVFVEVAFSTSGLSDELDISPQVELHKNGVFVGAYETPCGPWFAAPGSACDLCDGSICGTIKCDGNIISQMRCQLDPDSGACGCVSTDSLGILIPGVQVRPGDVLDVVLVPKPGALPELPGFDEDEEPDVGRWLDLGHALAGTHGDPVTLGEGTLIGGDPVSLVLSNALENSTAWLVLGISELGAPFKGGVLVPDPSPPGDFLPLPTGGAGVIGLAGAWPLGFPSGFSTYMQWWILDPVGPQGYAASNALVATTP